MSSSTFARNVQDAYINNDLTAARDAYREWQVGQCLHPQFITITDSHTCCKRKILVPCGKCQHCVETKINEWCTRMYAHAEDFKNVYFVTLTYRSITDPSLAVNQLLLHKLVQAVWHRDCFNHNKHYSYNPCLLVKKHYQDFIKRLRKNTGLTDITYVLSGEYGSTYGRPHFHMVLFTNGTLTQADVTRAWSVALWRQNDGSWSYRRNQKYGGTAFDFPIGRVDFHDLVQNGTFNTTAKIKVDGSYMNAANCFSYVCKYVCKRDKVNFSRVKLAYRSLFHTEKFVNLFDNSVSYKIAKQWLLDHGYTQYDAENLYNNQLKFLSYEKTIYQPCENVYQHGLLRSVARQKNGYSFNECLLPEVFFDFKSFYLPFCEFSRGTPIGSVYAKRNIQEFVQGIFTRPLLQSSGFVVPSYFRSKAQEYVYGFREVRKTFSSSSLAFGSLPRLHSLLDEMSTHGISLFRSSTPRVVSYSHSSYLFHSPEIFADKYTGERICFNPSSVTYYKYSRKKRDYLPLRSVSVADFARDCVIRLQLELDRYNRSVSQSNENLRLRERAFLLLTDMGESPSSLVSRFEHQQQAEYAERQRIYYSIHSSVE